jgi:hypothetical protein
MSKPAAASIACLVWAATTTGILLVANDGTSDASGLRAAQRGPVTLEYSRPWHRAPVVDPLPYGLELATPVQLRKAYASLWTGRIASPAPLPGGLPPGFAGNLHGAPLRQKAVLHDVPVMKYSGVVDPGASRFALYVVATDKSDYAILCTGATWSDVRRCEGLMQTAALASESVIPPGADAGLSQQLERLIGSLKEQGGLVSDLAAARSALDIGRSAKHLHRLYSRAGLSLADLQARPRDRRPVVALARALIAEANGLENLARSIDANREATYNAAAASVEANSHAVLLCLRQLRRIGFATVPLLPPLSIPPLPAKSMSAASVGELVHAPEGGVENPSSTEMESPAEAPGEEEEWEAAGEVSTGGAGQDVTGQASEPEAEAAEPVEAQGAR